MTGGSRWKHALVAAEAGALTRTSLDTTVLVHEARCAALSVTPELYCVCVSLPVLRRLRDQYRFVDS